MVCNRVAAGRDPLIDDFEDGDLASVATEVDHHLDLLVLAHDVAQDERGDSAQFEADGPTDGHGTTGFLFHHRRDVVLVVVGVKRQHETDGRNDDCDQDDSDNFEKSTQAHEGEPQLGQSLSALPKPLCHDS